VNDLILRDEYAANSWSGGALDLNFGSGGISRTDLGDGYDYPFAMATAPNGITYLACNTNAGSGCSIEAINADGSVDTVFGSDGIETLAITNLGYASAITVDSAGRILVAGSDSQYVVLLRLLPSGDLDTSFNANDTPGYVQSEAVGQYCWPAQILIEPGTNAILVIGQASSNSVGRIALARFTSAGVIDTTFGNDGLVTLLPSPATSINEVGSAALDSAGRIVISSFFNYLNTAGVTIVVRLNTDGSYDTNFGPNGQGYVVESSMSWAKLALQADGKIVLAGWGSAFTRLLPNGSVDPSFNSGNVLTCFSGVPVDEITDVVIDAFGSILVTGMADTDGNGDTGFFVGRISPDGVAGTYEVTPFPFQMPNDPTEYSYGESFCAEIRPDGKILVAGYDVDDDGLVLGLGLACYNAYDGLSQRLWVQHDANYNVTSIADVTGTVVQRFQEDPYGGNVVVLNGNWQLTTDNYTWLYIQQGGRYDPVAGVIHFDNRDLDPKTGAWRTPDPLGYVDGGDVYEYVGGNPTRYLDPQGTVIWGDCKEIGSYLKENNVDFGFPKDQGEYGKFYPKGGKPTTRPTTIPTTKPSNGAREILENMLASKRLFKVINGAASQLKLNVNYRMAIIQRADSLRVGMGESKYPDNWKTNPWLAWDNPAAGVLGCAQACIFVMMAAANDVKNFSPFAPLAVTRVSPVEDADWVPGDWGYIMNPHWKKEWDADEGKTDANGKPLRDFSKRGENLIYLGGGVYWGHAATKKTMPGWLTEIGVGTSWSFGEGPKQAALQHDPSYRNTPNLGMSEIKATEWD
jgi:RHS repeat-associated protein/uncharacterized delta-60 repeat protein